MTGPNPYICVECHEALRMVPGDLCYHCKAKKEARMPDPTPERPWWHPTPCDPDDNDRLLDCPYTNPSLWDHIGDAREDYVPLADDWFRLRAENERLRAALERLLCVSDNCSEEHYDNWPSTEPSPWGQARAALKGSQDD